HTKYESNLQRITSSFYWTRMKADIRDYIKHCELCQSRKKPEGKKANFKRMPEVSVPFERCSMDIVGPLVVSDDGYKYLLTYMCHFSKWAEAIPLRTQTTEEIADALMNQIFARHGFPKSLVSDNGSNFLSKVLEEVFEKLNIKRFVTSAYHPQSNQVERFHKTLINYLVYYVDQAKQTNWSKILG